MRKHPSFGQVTSTERLEAARLTRQFVERQFFGAGYNFNSAPASALTDLIVARLQEEMSCCVAHTGSPVGTVLPGMVVAYERYLHLFVDF